MLQRGEIRSMPPAPTHPPPQAVLTHDKNPEPTSSHAHLNKRLVPISSPEQYAQTKKLLSPVVSEGCPDQQLACVRRVHHRAAVSSLSNGES